MRKRNDPTHRSKWYGTLVTTTFGRNSSAALIASAVWLWKKLCHHRAGTTSGSTTVSQSGFSSFSTRSMRSEEHTSELQSRLHLVCRLLLEKKKKKIIKVGSETSSQVTGTSWSK